MTVQISNMVDNWNDASVKYSGIKMDVTDVNSTANSTLITITVNGTDRFVVDKSGTIISGTISANNVLGFAGVLDQVEEARDLAALYGSARIYENWADLSSAVGNANSAAIITSEAGTHTDPVTSTTVNNSGLYLWKTTPATGWKWIDNTVAFNAYESALVATAQANVAVSAATIASASLNLIHTLVLTQKLYYSTFADAIAATDVGDMFTCDEGGPWAYYIRTSVSPFYSLYKYVITEDYINSNVMGGANVYETWLDLGTTSAANGTIGVVLTNDAGNHSDPITSTSVNNSGVFVRYPAGWKRIANTEAFDARASAQSANTSMNISLAAAMTSVASANSAAFTYDAIKNLVLTEQHYYPTIAGGVANTTNGYIFSSDETGVWNFYKKTTTSPFYEYFSAISIPGGTQATFDYTSANNQTTFALDINPVDLSTEVFANGFRLQSTDFTVSGNTVVLDTPRANNDSVSIVVTGSTVGSFSSGAVTFNANTGYANGSIGKVVKDILVSGTNTTIASVTGLQAALDSKANTSHTHTISAVSGLQTALDGKANTSHTHTIANVTGLQSALDAKANTSHTHTIANVTGLQTALDTKANTVFLATTSGANTVGINDGSSGTKFTTVQGFRGYLLGNAGASQIGWTRPGSTIDRAVNAVLEAYAVCPEDYGATAIEDGATSTTSQTSFLINAMNSGRLVNCQGKTYNIGTPIAPTGTVRGIVNGNFAWTTTTAMAVQQYMISIIDKDDVRIDNCSFNLGTVEDCGSNDDSGRGAIRVSSSNQGVIFIYRPVVERNHVTGAGNGTGIYVRSADKPRVNFNIVENRKISGTASNDAQNGIDVSRSFDVQVEGNIVDKLYYRVSGTLTRIYSRGIVAVENTNGSFSRNFVSNVDQGMDFSGGIISGFPKGNTGLAVNGNVVHDTRTWGIKFANCIRNSVCSGNVVRNFGWGGIVVSGQSSDWTAGQESKATSHLLITGNYIYDPADYNSRTDCIGIWIIFRATYPGYPVYIRVINNTISNTTGNGRLLHGVAQDDGNGGHNIVTGAPYNEVRGNVVIGQTSTPTHGCVPDGVCALTGGSSQSISNATWTAVTWDVETIDGQGMHSTSSNPESIYPNGAGWYEVIFSLVFSENATGNRQARILRSGGSVPGGEYATVALTGSNTTLSGRCILYMSAGQNVRVEVYQTSGGALNVNRPNSQFYARRIEQM